MNPEDKEVKIPESITNPEEVLEQNPSTSPTPKTETHDPIKSLRTYQGDVQEAMTKDRSSATSIFVAEQNKRDKSLIDSPSSNFSIKTEDKNKFFAVLGGLLLILGGLAIGAGYYLRSNEQVMIEQRDKALLSFTEEMVLELDKTNRNTLTSAITDAKKNFDAPINSILYINIEKSPQIQADRTSVLEILSPSMPASLERTFSPQYMLGVYSFDTNEPFIILKTEDFAGSFAGMLRWEKDIPSDLGDIFVMEKNASSTIDAVFYDKEFKNRDMRIMKDSQGKTQFLYSFIDKNTLLITKNENIFSAILTKYLSIKEPR
ncbi:MAG: hypothetical protein V4690_02940 [Patescibacteria group bacterium]